MQDWIQIEASNLTGTNALETEYRLISSALIFYQELAVKCKLELKLALCIFDTNLN